tara:strand:+ start:207 stop:980 length:774 start_codon:yes stop_codon:yes gene_type:complete
MQIQLFLNSYSYKKLSGTLVPDCKRCESDKLRKDGKYKEFQQYKCKDCGFRFTYTSDLPKKRFHSSIIDFAVGMYITTGISLRRLARKIWKYFKTKVSYRTIHHWINEHKAEKVIVNSSRVWNADETSIRIKGKVHWLWLVIDRDNRSVLSWRLSRTRAYEDALAVMKEAKEGYGKPDMIITDGLLEYIRAIRKVFGWRQKVHYRKIKAAFGPNSILERLNREIKRRIRWFGTFQSFECAEEFINKWISDYNTGKVT